MELPRLSAAALEILVAYRWPGNVRELENAIKAAVAMADGATIHRHTLPASVAPRPGQAQGGGPLIDIDRPLPEVTEALIAQVERDYFVQLLERDRGNVARCAKHSGLSRRSVAQKLQKYDLDRTRFKAAARPIAEEAG